MGVGAIRWERGSTPFHDDADLTGGSTTVQQTRMRKHVHEPKSTSNRRLGYDRTRSSIADLDCAPTYAPGNTFPSGAGVLQEARSEE